MNESNNLRQLVYIKDVNKYNDQLINELVRIGRPLVEIYSLLKSTDYKNELELLKSLEKYYEDLGLKLPLKKMHKAPKHSDKTEDSDSLQKTKQHVTFDLTPRIHKFYKSQENIKLLRKLSLNKKKTAYHLTPDLMAKHKEVMTKRQELIKSGCQLKAILEKEKEAVEQSKDIVDHLNQEFKSKNLKSTHLGNQASHLSMSTLNSHGSQRLESIEPSSTSSKKLKIIIPDKNIFSDNINYINPSHSTTDLEISQLGVNSRLIDLDSLEDF